ncbi:hypothetical protein [Pontixanthobacter aquaemixtae]|uniref:Lysozyme inhibitor LprI N-terminal domain-containing protein n=1 Tax=Pontixanthobacter aquaemixtae TaxID=1958940 RepID=A0A844ZRC1_9SPHN|nr:hypothetical protein [Pontixanthobacter aquaemixtae]MXO89862.1 hypothetical protein [Pontixanthobacter aquaemixtae]
MRPSTLLLAISASLTISACNDSGTVTEEPEEALSTPDPLAQLRETATCWVAADRSAKVYDTLAETASDPVEQEEMRANSDSASKVKQWYDNRADELKDALDMDYDELQVIAGEVEAEYEQTLDNEGFEAMALKAARQLDQCRAATEG